MTLTAGPVDQLARQRFQRVAGTPITGWDDCPACSGYLTERTPHGAHCGTCLRYFTDPGWEPVYSIEVGPEFGVMTGERRWFPIDDADHDRHRRTVAWVVVSPAKATPSVVAGTLLVDVGLVRVRR